MEEDEPMEVVEVVAMEEEEPEAPTVRPPTPTGDGSLFLMGEELERGSQELVPEPFLQSKCTQLSLIHSPSLRV